MKYYVRYDYMEAHLDPTGRAGDAVSREDLCKRLGSRVVANLERKAKARGRAVRYMKRRINPCVVVVTA